MTKIATNLIILFLICVTTNMGMALYFLNVNKQTPKPVKEVSVNSREAVVLAAAIDKMYKDAHMRDTVIVQQVLKIQHELKMHESKAPLCPDCMNSSTTKEYHTADTDDFQ